MSGGEQQRVAIARCIVLEPRLLLLDEPLSNLDAKLRIELRYELKALHERLKVTTIYVTHDQTEALALSDRICVLRSGRVQQVGSPQDIFSKPANLFVAEFVGYKNAWSAKIERLRESSEGLEARIRVQGVSLDARLPYREGDQRREGIVAAYRSGGRVRTAIRPEDISVAPHPGMNALQCVTNLVEYQGHASQVSASFSNSAADGEAGARIDLRSAAAVAERERVEVAIPPDKILLFPADEEGEVS
jgi:putative spermidine/putrescine transport system ATP-binding protein